MSDDEPIRIGELLVKAGVLTQDRLLQRLALARQLGMPLGQILVQSRDIAKESLMGAIQIQSMIMEKMLTIDAAVQAIGWLCNEGKSLESVLEELGLADHPIGHRLGELLVASELISEEDLAFALLTSGEIAVPLGHVLVQTGVVPPDVVAVALIVQRQVRMNIVTAEEGIERIKVQCTPSMPKVSYQN